MIEIFTKFYMLLLAASLFTVTASAYQNTSQENTGRTINVEKNPHENMCIETDDIKKYKVESDHSIRFEMTNGFEYLMIVKRKCPQLYFHKYISYSPVNGRLCAGVDEIKTRSGLPCRIISFKKMSTINSTEPTNP